jgi:hypothetical protein
VSCAKPILDGQQVPETLVRNRSQFADRLHRKDGESDEVRPACPMQELPKEWTDVPAEVYVGHYPLCRNPECFGREWR